MSDNCRLGTSTPSEERRSRPRVSAFATTRCRCCSRAELVSGRRMSCSKNFARISVQFSHPPLSLEVTRECQSCIAEARDSSARTNFQPCGSQESRSCSREGTAGVSGGGGTETSAEPQAAGFDRLWERGGGWAGAKAATTPAFWGLQRGVQALPTPCGRWCLTFARSRLHSSQRYRLAVDSPPPAAACRNGAPARSERVPPGASISTGRRLHKVAHPPHIRC